jgi:hypothetical protein
MTALLILAAIAPPAIYVAFGLAQVHPLLAALPLVWCAAFMVFARRPPLGMTLAELLVIGAILVAVAVLMSDPWLFLEYRE